MKDKIIELLNQGRSYCYIERLLGCARSTISYHGQKLGRTPNPRAANRYNWNEISAYYKQGHTVKECMKMFGFCAASWDKATKRGAITARSQTFPYEDVLVENSSYKRTNLKKRLLKDGILKNECVICGLQELWQDKHLNMILDHINGVYNDNRLENLRLLCPNCNSQTDTFSGRNKKYKNNL